MQKFEMFRGSSNVLPYLSKTRRQERQGLPDRDPVHLHCRFYYQVKSTEYIHLNEGCADPERDPGTCTFTAVPLYRTSMKPEYGGSRCNLQGAADLGGGEIDADVR
jgi:hypothetical protein